jgi:hypothetical protein
MLTRFKALLLFDSIPGPWSKIFSYGTATLQDKHITKFKKAIRKEQSDNTKRIPKLFYYGPRKLNINRCVTHSIVDLIVKNQRNAYSLQGATIIRFNSGMHFRIIYFLLTRNVCSVFAN